MSNLVNFPPPARPGPAALPPPELATLADYQDVANHYLELFGDHCSPGCDCKFCETASKARRALGRS